ncbi:hypothetical protein G7Z17_g5383 [Cylindrodendrum hubeiense]|uniref:Uncharacterized protein n=1 Tax=Cylindrodendrum hubeiense TaxID=595255 RepID=A0A9P5HAZ9_9HYPO|nr:hypothetical protein G7Z17_g5383 [Cylindrodendrum hubeiense]
MHGQNEARKRGVAFQLRSETPLQTAPEIHGNPNRMQYEVFTLSAFTLAKYVLGVLNRSWLPWCHMFIVAISELQNSPALAVTLLVILPISIAYTVNGILNRRVQGGLISDDLWDWTKEIILITGGSGGMGKLIVQEFAQRNIKVVILDLSPPNEPLPTGVFFYKADITSPEAVHKVAEEVRHDIGDPTVLINNAGIAMGKSILNSEPSFIRRMFEVNTLSHFWLIQEFLPAMIKRNHGHVVTMASMASFVVIAGNVDYSCTKASALAFHEGLGQELKHWHSAGKIRTRSRGSNNLAPDPSFGIRD